MKNYYEILDLDEGASKEEIREAYERLSKELDPKNNNDQEFFKEEYKKVQEAYKALHNSSMLATKKGAKQLVKKPNPSSKNINNNTKTPIEEIPRNPVLKKGIIISISIIAIGIVAYFMYNVPATYQYDEVVFNKGLVYLKKDMSFLTGKINSKYYKGEVINGKKEGLHRDWHSNGQLEEEVSYVDGKSQGLSRNWYSNGQLRGEGSYINDISQGLYRNWHSNGQLEAEGSYVNGKKEGIHIEWNSRGNITDKASYVDGKIDRQLFYELTL